MKNIKHIIAALLMAAPLIYLMIVWKSIPETVALHYDFEGKPDKTGSKDTLLIWMCVMVIFNMLMYLLLCNAHRLDPKKGAVQNKERLRNIALAVAIFIALIQVWLIYTTGTNERVLSMKFVLTGVCILFSILGNYMNNIKPNYFAGLRLPWTLENEENWRKTHHYASKIWFGGGLLAALVCLLMPLHTSVILLVVLLLVMIILPTIYSYRLYQKMKH